MLRRGWMIRGNGMSLLERFTIARWRPLVAGLCGTAALVIWGMLFWGWLYQFFGIFNKLPVDRELADLLVANETATATYFFPWPRNTPETFAAFVEQHRTGPFFQLSYIREGVDPQSPTKILLGVLHYFVVAMLAAVLVRLALPTPASFGRRFLVVFLAGVIGTTFIRLSDPIWFHLPWQHALGNALYELIAWLLLGLVTGALLKHRTA
jgi:hypothetical protein